MGVYDEIEVGDRAGQVKLWECEMHTYRQGDEVPSYGADQDYSVAMREGGFVNVTGSRIIDWTEEPRHSLTVDKWGGAYTAESRGEFEDSYLFADLVDYLDDPVPSSTTERRGDG